MTEVPLKLDYFIFIYQRAGKCYQEQGSVLNSILIRILLILKEGFIFHVQDLSINVVAVLGTLMFVCVS